jgi:cell division protein FtsQ
MARKSTAQLDLELPDDPEGEAEAPAPRRPRAKPDSALRRPRLRLWLRVAGGVLALAAAVVVPYQVDQFLASDPHFLLTAKGITIEGVVYTPSADVTRALAADLGRSVYLVPLAQRRQALLKIDWVKDAAVSRFWPNRLRIRIVERRPVAFLMLLSPDGSLGAWLIDSDGVILRPPSRARLSLPVLHGVTRSQSPSFRGDRMRQVTALIAELSSYAPQISEIDVSDSADLIVTQIVEGRAIRLRLGNRNYLARLRSFLKSYPDISRRLPNARTFDLRLDNYFLAEDGGSHAR